MWAVSHAYNARKLDQRESLQNRGSEQMVCDIDWHRAAMTQSPGLVFVLTESILGSNVPDNKESQTIYLKSTEMIHKEYTPIWNGIMFFS